MVGKQSIPALFLYIIQNDAERAALKALPVVPFCRFRELARERIDFRRAAEQALRWNTDKGNTA